MDAPNEAVAASEVRSEAGLDAARRMSHGEQLARMARKHPQRTAFVCRDLTRTFGEIDHRVDRLARALADRGVGAGDRVALLMGNSIEMVEALFAGWRLGAVVVPVNFRLVALEVEYVLADSGARAVVVDAALAPIVAAVRPALPAVGAVIVVDDPEGDGDPEGDEGDEGGRAGDDLERHGVTGCVFVGLQWDEVCDEVAGRAGGAGALRLRRASWGAANTPVHVLDKMHRTFPGVAIFSFFGQTEMSPVTCVLGAVDAVRKQGSVGRPVINVEAAISSHPGVAEAAVVGVPHERWGETPLAVVEPVDPARPPTSDEIVAWCRERLASYKKPTAVVVVDALPRNATGKVVKPKLRERYGHAAALTPTPPSS